jgi:hypothetical protein
MRCGYACEICGQQLQFEEWPRGRGAAPESIIGWCPNGGYVDWTGVRRRPACERFEVRLQVPLERLHCEPAPPQGKPPHVDGYATASSG